MASEEKKSEEKSEEKLEKKKHRGIPEALFLVSLYSYSGVTLIFYVICYDITQEFFPNGNFLWEVFLS